MKGWRNLEPSLGISRSKGLDRLPRLFAALQRACDPRRKRYLASYFDPGSREQGSARRYVGLTAVAARRVAVQFSRELTRPESRALLASNVPEHRYVALEVLVRQYETGNERERERIAKFYLRQLRSLDHWLLVDTSAPYVLGEHLRTRPRTLLGKLAASPDFVMRRMALVTTLAFIRANDFDDTLRIAAQLRSDPHPLVQRAAGWMLREVGKRSRVTLERFLREHAHAMPSLMLSYATERLPKTSQREYRRAQRAKAEPSARKVR